MFLIDNFGPPRNPELLPEANVFTAEEGQQGQVRGAVDDGREALLGGQILQEHTVIFLLISFVKTVFGKGFFGFFKAS